MVKEELKIVGWVQHMRCVRLAMQKLFTKEQWQLIENEAKYRVISFNEQTHKEIFVNETDFKSVMPAEKTVNAGLLSVPVY